MQQDQGLGVHTPQYRVSDERLPQELKSRQRRKRRTTAELTYRYTLLQSVNENTVRNIPPSYNGTLSCFQDQWGWCTVTLTNTVSNLMSTIVEVTKAINKKKHLWFWHHTQRVWQHVEELQTGGLGASVTTEGHRVVRSRSGVRKSTCCEVSSWWSESFPLPALHLLCVTWSDHMVSVCSSFLSMLSKMHYLLVCSVYWSLLWSSCLLK